MILIFEGNFICEFDEWEICFCFFFWDYIFTYRAKQDNGRPVCGTVQKDVRGTFRNGLGKWGNEVVATFTITSFGRDERSRTIVRNAQARIDLQGMFTQYGKRWASLQIQWNGVYPSPTTFGSVFLQAEKTFPIRLVPFGTKRFRSEYVEMRQSLAWSFPKSGSTSKPISRQFWLITIRTYLHKISLTLKRRTWQNIHHSAAFFFKPKWL